jgi:outer membrane protein assembly factor BamB
MKYYIILLLFSLSASVCAADLPKLPENAGGLLLYMGQAKQDVVANLAKMAESPRLLAQILIKDEDQLSSARALVAKYKTKGQLSVQVYNGKDIPVVSNVANFIICSSAAAVSKQELMRALAPRGIAYLQKNSNWQKLDNPVPDDIDDWSHALYNPANTVVSKDMQVGPPRRLQWMSGPGWSRSHEHMVSFNAMVSEGGIVYYMVDLGSRSAVALPARWTLIARDAFNGKELWRKSLPSWMNHMWPLKSGPTEIQRRLVAVDGKVYLPLGALAPVSQLDGRTGEILQTYEGTSNVDEIIVDGDQMIVQMGEQVAKRESYTHDKSHVWMAAGDARQRFAWNNEKRKIVSINASTGTTSWTHETPCVAMTLHMTDDTIFFFDGGKARALNRINGKALWTSDFLGDKNQKTKKGEEDLIKFSELAAGYAPTMFYYGGAVLLQFRQPRTPGIIYGLDPKSGKILWTQKPQHSGHHSPEDLLPLQGLLWTGGTYRVGKGGGTYQGLNPLTGKVEKEFAVDVQPDFWFHQRCYRAKATERFLIPAATGTEYIDPKTGHWDLNHWVRGGCLYGIMPANGLTYVPPNPCACFSESQLRTLGAFAPAEPGVDLTSIDPEGRFVKGPAFDTVEDMSIGTADWPMYRNDISRSGATTASVSATVKEKWRVSFAGRISAPIAANGLALVSLIDDHQIVAIDQKSGQVKWRFNTGARVDSAPTIYKGRVLFGATDGWVSCISLKNGELVWRYRSAPQNKLFVADEQVESVWPLLGSVLIHNERLYAVCGRSTFVDGGLLMSVLNPLTGECINEVRFDATDPITGEHMQLRTQGSKMPISRPDILSVKGDYIFMGSQKIDKDGKRMWPTDIKEGSVPGEKSLTINKSQQGGEDIHLFSLSGFLDDSWFHRTYWIYGVAAGGGWGGWMTPMKLAPAGRILSVGKDTVYGYGRKPVFIRQSSVTEYQIFATKKGQFTKEAAKAFQPKKPELVMGPEQAEIYNKLKKELKDLKKEFGNKDPKTKKAALAFASYRTKMKKLKINQENDLEFKNNNPSMADWKASVKFDDSMTVLHKYDWRELDPKIMVRAMTLAGNTLITAGPADTLDEASLYGMFTAESKQAELKEQEAAFNGERGGHLWLLDANSGKHLAELELNSVPVFDGMAVANGSILLSQKNGDLVSFGE